MIKSEKMSTIKILSPDDDVKHILFDLFKIDKTFNRNLNLTNNEVDQKIEMLLSGIESNKIFVCVQLTDDGKPINLITSSPLTRIQGWVLGLVKISQSTNHFYKTCKIIAPCHDFLISYMESLGYYKFWVMGPDKELEIRWHYMRKVSSVFSRYNSYDEIVIKKGTLSGVAAFDLGRNIDYNNDIVVKLMSLESKVRRQLLGLENYKFSRI
jgi:hypothetical protein